MPDRRLPGGVIDARESTSDIRLIESQVCGSAIRFRRRATEGQWQSLESLLELSAALQAIAHQTDDHHEAVSAMLERRAPKFTGRQAWGYVGVGTDRRFSACSVGLWRVVR